MTEFQMSPDPSRARANNAAMQDGLLASLASLDAQAGMAGIALFRPGALDALESKIRTGGRASASAFGAYYDLIAELVAGNINEAGRLARHIEANAIQFVYGRSGVPDIRHLTDDYLPGDSLRMVRLMGSPATGLAGIRAPDRACAQRYTARLADAFAWMARSAPELHEEFCELIGEIVLVAPESGDPDGFEGGTCFRLWGALFLNAERDVSLADMILTLAHEEAHAVLFGECRDEMLVENPDTELYWSPIRQAERPLEGIFHAGFVSARMLWTLERMTDDARFADMPKAWFERQKDSLGKTCAECAAIVRQHGRLTGTGERVLAALETYLASGHGLHAAA